MNHNPHKYHRILAISLSANGIGYAVLEGEKSLIAYGSHVLKGDKDKMSVAKVKKHIEFYQPDLLLLQDVLAKDSKRLQRIRRLHQKVITLAGDSRLKVKRFAKTQVGQLLLNNSKAKNHDMAQLIATQFPEELASRLPPKRKCYAAEDPRMDMFEAVGLVAAFRVAVVSVARDSANVAKKPLNPAVRFSFSSGRNVERES